MLYRARRLAEAEKLLQPLLDGGSRSADAWRLAGMVARAAGAPVAESRLRHALALAPRHPETMNVLGGLMLDLGRRDDAERWYRSALEAAPGHPAVTVNLCRMLLAARRFGEVLALTQPRVSPDAPANLWRVQAEALLQAGRQDEALAAFEQSLRREPGSGAGQLGRIRALLALGRFEEVLEAAARAQTPDFVVARAQALVALGRWQEALHTALACARSAPAHGRAVFLCAQIMWMQGETDAAAAFLDEMLERDAGLATDLLCAAAFRGMERYDAASRALAMAEARHGVSAATRCERVSLHIDLEEAPAALSAAEHALALAPDDPEVRVTVVQARLMSGLAEKSLPLIDEALARHPSQQFWLAMRCDALRQLGDPEYERLLDFERMACVYRLSPPEGFDSIEAYNAVLRERPERLHQVRAHPLDQSLKLGTQTHVDLRFVDDPVVQAFFGIIRPAIRAYIEAMPADATHPLYARRDPAAVPASVWSVRLQPGGRHVSHIHPEGWISSAYYVDVPPRDPGDGPGGALELGAPPFSQPGAGPRRRIPAAPGNLVLFPSYMWHGTVPSHQGVRLSIAFDVTPTREPGRH